MMLNVYEIKNFYEFVNRVWIEMVKVLGVVCMEYNFLDIKLKMVVEKFKQFLGCLLVEFVCMEKFF